MKHQLKYFDDNCYELTTLRWFRDKFVTKSDIQYYYQIAPIIVNVLIMFLIVMKCINKYMKVL